MTTVSIIMPCFNSANFIAEAVTSVISQTFQDWELIVIDDCSRDSSRAIVETFAKRDSRIRIFSLKSQKGPGMARNRGLDESSGDLIVFLDSDDAWPNNYLSTVVPILNERHFDVVTAGYFLCDEALSPFKEFSVSRQIKREDILTGCPLSCLTTIFRASLVRNARFGGSEREDLVFWWHLLDGVNCVFGVQSPLGYYRVHKTSRSGHKLLAAASQWRALRRDLNFPFLVACKYFAQYGLNGARKYWL